MANRIRNWVLVVTMLVIAGVAVGQEGIPPVPSPPRLVNDLTGTTLTGGEINALEQKLLNYEDTTSTQIAILIVATVQPYDIADFGQRTAQSWGIGGQEDNGVLIVVATEDRQIHIATGYGMEGVVPDAAAYTIITDYIQPNFRAGNFLGGLDEATSAIMGLASGEYTAEELAGDDNSMSWLPVVLFIIIFFVIPMIASKNRRRRAVGSRDIPWWIFLGGPGGGSSRNGWNDFSRGGGDFGGFGGGGGGGFGGFGGGGFGGGGASGGW